MAAGMRAQLNTASAGGGGLVHLTQGWRARLHRIKTFVVAWSGGSRYVEGSMSQTPSNASGPEDHRPHKPADDREEVYYEGSPMLRGDFGKLVGWGILGLVLIASPVLYNLYSNK